MSEDKEEKTKQLSQAEIDKKAIAEADKESLGEQATTNMGSIIFYACIVFIGLLVALFLSSDLGSALMETLGKVASAGLEILEQTGKHPWLFFLLPLLAPLLRFLPIVLRNLGSYSVRRQSMAFNRMFSDKKYRNRNKALLAQFRSFMRESKGNARLVKAKFDLLGDEYKATSAEIKRIDNDPNNKTLTDKADAITRERINKLQSQTELAFDSSWLGAAQPGINFTGDSTYAKNNQVQRLVYTASMNGSMNSSTMMMSGEAPTINDMKNSIRAVRAVEFGTLNEAFEKSTEVGAESKKVTSNIKERVLATAAVTENFLKLQDRVAVLRSQGLDYVLKSDEYFKAVSDKVKAELGNVTIEDPVAFQNKMNDVIKGDLDTLKDFDVKGGKGNSLNDVTDIGNVLDEKINISDIMKRSSSPLSSAFKPQNRRLFGLLPPRPPKGAFNLKIPFKK